MDRLWLVVAGGLVPAVAFGLSAIFQKAALVNGVGVGTYALYFGLSVALAGLVIRLVLGESEWAIAGLPYAMLAGFGVSVGIGLVSYAVLRLGAPISFLVPIHVLGTLVTVIVGFIVFKEYENVAALRLIGGALLVMAGAALVATS